MIPYFTILLKETNLNSKQYFYLFIITALKNPFPYEYFFPFGSNSTLLLINKSKLTSIWQKYSFYFAGKLLINHKQIITRGLTSKTSLKIWPQKVSWKWYFTFNSLPPLSMSNVCLTCLHQYGKLCTKSMLSGEKCQSRHNSKHF